MKYISKDYLEKNAFSAEHFGPKVLVIGIGTIKYATSQESIEINDTNIPFHPVEVEKEVIKEIKKPSNTRKGYWIFCKNQIDIECSRCHARFTVKKKERSKYKYCPSCNAKMSK